MSLQADSGCEKLSGKTAELKLYTIQLKTFSILKKRSGKIIVLTLIIMLLALLGIIVTYLVVFLSSTEPHSHSCVYQLIQKEKWDGKPALRTIPLQHPTALVIISHTATRSCLCFQDCIPLVKSAQNYHMDQKQQPDIGYNFLIGGDGSIFEGRGWDAVNFHRDGSIGICFIGNYVVDYLNVDMVASVVDLLDRGVRMGKLDEDYVLVGHNQTKATLSPGTNVYKVIKNWMHFNSSKLF